jgi:hypothetical protein
MGFLDIVGDGRGDTQDFFGRMWDHESLVRMILDVAKASRGAEVKMELYTSMQEKEVTMSDVGFALNQIVAAFREAFPEGRTLRVFIPSDAYRSGPPGKESRPQTGERRDRK